MWLYRDSVVVVRAPLMASPYGQSRDWDAARQAGPALRASVQPVSDRNTLASDASLDRETGITTYRVYTPGQADIRVEDRIRYRNQLYEVVGVPVVWPAVASDKGYTMATVRRING